MSRLLCWLWVAAVLVALVAAVGPGYHKYHKSEDAAQDGRGGRMSRLRARADAAEAAPGARASKHDMKQLCLRNFCKSSVIPTPCREYCPNYKNPVWGRRRRSPGGALEVAQPEHRQKWADTLFGKFDN